MTLLYDFHNICGYMIFEYIKSMIIYKTKQINRYVYHINLNNLVWYSFFIVGLPLQDDLKKNMLISSITHSVNLDFLWKYYYYHDRSAGRKHTHHHWLYNLSFTLWIPFRRQLQSLIAKRILPFSQSRLHIVENVSLVLLD